MTISYVEATTIGVDSLRDLVGLESKDLRARGVPKTDAFDGVKLAHIYWGPTHATRLQRKARDAARTRRHTVKTLKKIENHVKKEKKTPDRLRVKLCDTPAEKIDEVAAKWLPAPEKKPTARHTYRKDGWHKLVLDTNEPWLIDLFNLLPGVNESGPQNFDNLLEGFKALTEGKAKDTVPGRAAHIVITLDDVEEILDGTAGEKKFRATDGTVRTGKQLVEEKLLGAGLVTLATRWNEPVDCYRVTPLFNRKQTAMAWALWPQCIHPGCKAPAMKCQRDHLIAWAKGGMTNASNLVPLCAHHNGKKADGNSYFRDEDGVLWFVTPYGKRIECTVD
ncbi:HNH endonuclease domain protein [Corynebacterium sp. CMW7794]|uniref:HNH endonuclease signature motif containing protein n=1 Tax=Corynebacterium sp. CMW7794 TaxID=1603887 RepID=UPI0007993D90|nr:HNH endonuclease signature motif containing protein [Corynebacterium sp. CMW7794]KXI15072.1 HNH endonuclease domain protein [Corynebacterium sp. CMW7794]